MQTSDFHFNLPESLIAQTPPEKRGDSRLLVVDPRVDSQQRFQDKQFQDFPNFLHPGDLLVFNDTKVIPARLFGQKSTGGKVEVLVERVLDDSHVLAHVRAGKPPKPGNKMVLESEISVEMERREGEFFQLRFDDPRPVLEILETVGRIPLPPYIERTAEDDDNDRYQTVYAKEAGAVAAPTAGLHFDEAMLETLKKQGIETGFVTLHVGAGTFQPVRVDDIDEHKMHSERIEVNAKLCEQIRKTRQRGGRVIAVGTTVVRSLESAARHSAQTQKNESELQPFSGETDIFITPGYPFRVIDTLLTNFHLPESTLIMLVSAFSGRKTILDAYQHAVEQQYRFFSYGDAMFLTTRIDPAYTLV